MTLPLDTYQTRNWPDLKAETLARATRGAYPAFGIAADDARDALAMIDSLDPEQWGAAWLTIGNRGFERAEAAENSGDPDAARAQYRAAWRLFTLGRWPVAVSPKKAECGTRAATAFASFGRLSRPVIEPVSIPLDASSFQGWLVKPETVKRPPVLLSIGGSDLWKDHVADQSHGLARHGIAVLTADMPGAGDAPLPARPGSERIFAAALDFIASRDDLDSSRVVLRGQSWGSYWAARAGYAQAQRLKGIVFQSGPVHHYFQPAWQEAAFKTQEFLFDYVPSRLHMLGVKTVAEAFAMMPLLSLIDLIDRPTPPMLVIGGAKDTQVPFDDTVLLLTHGSPKHAWINPDGGTMGRSATLKDDEIVRSVIMPWVRQRFEG